MPKRFNTLGACIPGKHYMVDISNKLDKIIEFIEQELYFVINRPRQYGKTTTLLAVKQRLLDKENYLPINISFESISSEEYLHESGFIDAFLIQLHRCLNNLKTIEIIDFIKQHGEIKSITQLSLFISKLTSRFNYKMVLIIDEVDKSSNNQLFLDFLGILRDKYLLRSSGDDTTFHSVILAGVHDVKTLKLKLRPDDIRKYNSPWNIAKDFKVDMSFSTAEITTMSSDYQKEQQLEINLADIAKNLRFYTSGYPFLVSRICEVIDTELEQKWNEDCIKKAVKIILSESTANFDDLIKNLENNPDLYKYVRSILIDGVTYTYNIDNPIINLGVIYGILANHDGMVAIHNHIYAQRIYNYMISKMETEMENLPFRGQFIENGQLNMQKILLKFQQFMREQYSTKDEKFLEREGRLILLAFIKPIINGQGFDFKEVQISEEKRLDIVITFFNHKYVLELKRWYGEEAHHRGLMQLADYLEIQGLDNGYLVVFDFSKDTENLWTEDQVMVDGKEIRMLRV